MIMTASGGVQGKVSEIQVCAGCNKKIHDKYVLKVSTSSSSLPSLTVLIQAMDLFWHEDCLKCGCCDARLGEVGQSLYTKGNLLLCKRDYLRSGLLHPTSFSHPPLFRLFGSTGYCAACKKIIPAFEMVMRARSNVYHLECFACQECGHRFCVGDQFFLYDNKVLCSADYEERMVFASLSSNPAQLAAIKHQDSNRYYNNNNNNNISAPQQLLKHHSQPLPPISSVRSASSFLPEQPS